MRLFFALVLMSSCAYAQQVTAGYGRLPLSFEVNQGQVDSQVKFLSRGSGYGLSLTKTEATFSLDKEHVRMQFLGADAAGSVSGVDELPGRSNYFIGNDPKAWRVGIPTYARVKYTKIYPGIDVVYYGNQRELEYDINVAPGADPGKIRLRVAGRVELNGGDVVLGESGRIRMKKPI